MIKQLISQSGRHLYYTGDQEMGFMTFALTFHGQPFVVVLDQEGRDSLTALIDQKGSGFVADGDNAMEIAPDGEEHVLCRIGPTRSPLTIRTDPQTMIFESSELRKVLVEM